MEVDETEYVTDGLSREAVRFIGEAADKKDNPFFFIGGYLLPEGKTIDLENTLTQIQLNFFGSTALRTDTEFHGKEMFHGKSHFKKRKLSELWFSFAFGIRQSAINV